MGKSKRRSNSKKNFMSYVAYASYNSVYNDLDRLNDYECIFYFQNGIITKIAKKRELLNNNNQNFQKIYIPDTYGKIAKNAKIFKCCILLDATNNSYFYYTSYVKSIINSAPNIDLFYLSSPRGYNERSPEASKKNYSNRSFAQKYFNEQLPNAEEISLPTFFNTPH